MKIHHEELEDVRLYLENHKDIPLEEKETHFRNILNVVQRYKPVDANSRVIEIGTGTGWFPLLCQQNGIPCEGLEISPQFVEVAKAIGARYNLVPDIRVGNLEETDLGIEQYDVIIASNVFEHVEYWREGLATVYRAMKPGGLLFFESTNKFSFTSGEYPDFPLYGWLPDQWRYKLRIRVHGPDIMKLGIDFHQFRYSLLRREFEKLGFREILDRVQTANEDTVSTAFRRIVVKASRALPPVKALSLTFADATRFVCLK